MKADYTTTTGRTPDETFIHCRMGNLAYAIAVLDGSPDEYYKLPPDVTSAIRNRLYAICMEQLMETRDASTEVSPRSADEAGNDHHRL